MNQTVTILLIDVLILFTGILTEGNPDDLNTGSVKNYGVSTKFAGVIYSTIFLLCILVHLVILFRNTYKSIKLMMLRTYHRIKQ